MIHFILSLLILFVESKRKSSFFQDNSQIKFDIPSNSKSRLLQSPANLQPVDILWNLNCNTGINQMPTKQSHQIQIIPALGVFTLSGETKINSVQPCANMLLPVEVSSNNNILPNGKNALVYVVPLIQFDYAAVMSPCLMGDLNNRPLVALLSLNVDIISSQMKRFEEYFGTFLHEMIHFLALNEYYFPYFINSTSGQPYKLSDIYDTNFMSRGTVTRLLKTPKVLDAARRHFNCPTMVGMELENQGDGTHWDQRLVGNEIMNSYQSTNQLISGITNAVFWDSGWYQVSQNASFMFKFGNNEGCDFINNKCLNTTLETSFSEFCTVKGLSGCSGDYTSLSLCTGASSSTNSQISSSMNYYGNGSYSYIDVMDNCPYFIPLFPLENGICIFDSGKIQNYAYFDQGFSVKSRCFSGTWSKQENITSIHSGCLESRCTIDASGNSNLYLTIGSQEYQCPPFGGALSQITNHTGSVTCPEANEFCKFFNEMDRFYKLLDYLSGNKFLLETQPTIITYAADGSPITYQTFVDAFNVTTYNTGNPIVVNGTTFAYDPHSLASNLTISIQIRSDYNSAVIVGIGRANANIPNKFQLQNGLDGDGYSLYRLDFVDTLPANHILKYDMPSNQAYSVFLYLSDCNTRGTVTKSSYSIN